MKYTALESINFKVEIGKTKKRNDNQLFEQ